MLSGKPRVKKPARSFELWVLVIGLFITAAVQFGRMQQSLSLREVLDQYHMAGGPLYAALTGGVSGLMLLTAAMALFFRCHWAPIFTRIVAVLFAAWFWADRIIFTQSADGTINTPFQIGATVIGLAFVFGVLALDRQKRFFGRSA